MENTDIKKIVMLPLSEILSVRWTEARQRQLRRLRGDVKLTELARKLAEAGVPVSRQYLHRMETDPEVKGASPELIQGLCQVLDVSFPELLCLESQRILQLGVDKCN